MKFIFGQRDLNNSKGEGFGLDNLKCLFGQEKLEYRNLGTKLCMWAFSILETEKGGRDKKIEEERSLDQGREREDE